MRAVAAQLASMVLGWALLVTVADAATQATQETQAPQGTQAPQPATRGVQHTAPPRGPTVHSAPPRQAAAAPAARFQNTLRTNSAALHKVMNATAKGPLVRQATSRQVVARSAAAVTSRASNISGPTQSATNRIGATYPNHSVPGTAVATSNSVLASRHAPTGLATLGGTPTRRNVGVAAVNGNAIRRPF